MNNLINIINSRPIKECIDDIVSYFEINEETEQEVSFLKSKVQQEAKQTIINAKGRGLLCLATGVGKSRIAIDYAEEINRILQESEVRNANILLVVPTEKLRDENWKEEFEKWNKKHLWENIERSCYASISKITDKKYDYVILDEVHNITENNSEFFFSNNNTIGHIIGLTATKPTDSIKNNILNRLSVNETYNLSLDEATKLRIVSKYEIVVVKMQLDSVKKNVIGGTKAKSFLTTEVENYTYLNKMFTKALYSKKNTAIKAWALKRMRFIYDLKSKEEVAKFLLNFVIPREERTIVFAGSIRQADEVSEYSYHSKSKNDTNLVKFKNKEINKLACVKGVNEGHNLNNVDSAIVIQLNSNDKDLIQRIGRAIRYRKNHTSTIYIIIAENTIDEKWLQKAILGLDVNNIKIIQYNSLKDEYQQTSN